MMLVLFASGMRVAWCVGEHRTRFTLSAPESGSSLAGGGGVDLSHDQLDTARPTAEG
jgi:hypothetical protein